MPETNETIQHALEMHRKSLDRIKELQAAVDALAPDSQYFSAVHCTLGVTQGAAWTVDIRSAPDFVRPLFEAALLKERDAEARMRRKLDAALTAMHAQS